MTTFAAAWVCWVLCDRRAGVDRACWQRVGDAGWRRPAGVCHTELERLQRHLAETEQEQQRQRSVQPFHRTRQHRRHQVTFMSHELSWTGNVILSTYMSTYEHARRYASLGTIATALCPCPCLCPCLYVSIVFVKKLFCSQMLISFFCDVNLSVWFVFLSFFLLIVFFQHLRCH